MNQTNTNTETKQEFKEWALVELFGHQKIVGLVTEQSIAGGAFLRVDVPAFDGAPAFTRFYGHAAIYSINPVTEEIARGLLAQYRHEPVSRWELPQIADKVQEPEDGAGYDVSYPTSTTTEGMNR